jgi:GTP-binding protein
MLVDTLRFDVQGGRGGNGCVSFRHERRAPRGGPDGGDGGNGGNVLIVADARVQDLSHLVPRRLLRAERGRDGEGRRVHGRSGQDLVLRLPIGTAVSEAETLHPLVELMEPDQEHLLVRGGKGGKGNCHFATPTNRAPRRTTAGEPGERRIVVLEVKLPSDAALIGLPNAGKSSLLARLTGATPKVAAYPFTTRQPEAGVLATGSFSRLTILDLPPLMRGACRGKGLGCGFLRHAERARLLVLVLGPGMPGPRESYRTIRDELAASDRGLESKPHMVVLTKRDQWDPPDAATFPNALAVVPVSLADERSVYTLADRLISLLAE